MPPFENLPTDLVLQGIFLLVAGLIVVAAVAVVTLRNIFHSALALILCFSAVAGLYILLEAPFVAAVQVLIYVGAISVLILFAVMLTERVMDPKMGARNEQWWLGLLLTAIAATGLGAIVGFAPWPLSKAPIINDQITALGKEFLTTYVLPFEVASLLLLMALLGAIIIAREKEGG
ncbi:MAG: NADH-quinone oxidoreductase subunit J [Chloroflexi bacterium]|nr:NADH-quinone oxidoreductase subunit J [Chloroflexota bacterium]